MIQNSLVNANREAERKVGEGMGRGEVVTI
jgi:hypothetical protein